MSSLDSILSLLDKWPKWKRLTELPDKLAAMEMRVQELEKKLSAKGDNCPKCHERTFQLISSKKDSTFGALGGMQRLYRCSSCQFEETKLVT